MMEAALELRHYSSRTKTLSVSLLPKGKRLIYQLALLMARYDSQCQLNKNSGSNISKIIRKLRSENNLHHDSRPCSQNEFGLSCTGPCDKISEWLFPPNLTCQVSPHSRRTTRLPPKCRRRRSSAGSRGVCCRRWGPWPHTVPPHRRTGAGACRGGHEPWHRWH